MSIIACIVAVYQLNCLLLHLRNVQFHKRKQLLQVTSTSIRKLKRKKTYKERRFWIKPGRTSAWWDNFVAGIVIPEEWKENLRMSKDSFYGLCNQLRPFIERKETNMRSPVDVEKQVALTL